MILTSYDPPVVLTIIPQSPMEVWSRNVLHQEKIRSLSADAGTVGEVNIDQHKPGSVDTGTVYVLIFLSPDQR